MMSHRRLRRWAPRLLLLGILAAVTVATAADQFVPTPFSKTELARALTVDGVSVKRLARGGNLLLPPAARPLVRQEDAERVAAAQLGGATVRQTILAEVHSMSPTAQGRLCWVVSMLPHRGIWHPSSGPPRGGGYQRRLPGTYILIFVDAVTGEFVMGHGG